MKLYTIESKMRGGIKSQAAVTLQAVLFILVGGGAVAKFATDDWAWWKTGLAVMLVVGLVVNAYFTWRNASELAEQYDARLRSLKEETYHAISFASKEEAAAFVAALGRQLHAPYHGLASFDEDVEIAATSDSNGTVLYLSDGAVKAFETAFVSPPVTRAMLGKDLPTTRIPVLVGAPDEPIGMDDVMRRLNGKRPTVGHRTLRLTDPRYSDGMPR